jgi:hypothetical protein
VNRLPCCVAFSVLLIGCSVARLSAAETNLLANPTFTQDANGDGVPDAWRASGDAGVTQTLSIDRDGEGIPCAKLGCTAFTATGAASHVMLCQMDIPIERGRYYRLAFRARSEGISGDIVQIGMRDTRSWATLGLDEAFVPQSQWKDYAFTFQAPQDCPTGSRLQIWFTSTGTLWIADAELVKTERPQYGPGKRFLPGMSANLVPNASFECGTFNWGSEQLDRETHWGGSMNRLFGTLDAQQPFDGSHCLQIELSPENRPVSWFDYFDLSRQEIRAPLAASLGFMRVAPGKPHTLSAYVRAAKADTPCRLVVRQLQGGDFDRAVSAGTDWQRHAITFTPKAEWCYVLVGPDLRLSRGAEVPADATVWIDAVQLEASGEATPFVPHSPIEIGLSTEKIGNVFDWNEPLEFVLHVNRSPSAGTRPVKVDLSLVDFDEETVWQETVEVPPDAAGSSLHPIRLAPDECRRGWMRMAATVAGNPAAAGASLRLASIPVCHASDSRFGVNHAYPWPHLLDLCRKAGLLWVRDWSCKWHEVEPEPGRFTFAETDLQIDRPRSHGLEVLGLAPFPSSYWSSNAPGDYDPSTSYTKNRERISYAPREQGPFERYVQKTVDHYRGRIAWWQVFNEPLYTSYSLPRSFGYTGADYARWVKVFSQTARSANPDCKILAGIGGIHEGAITQDWTEFLAAGALNSIDAVDIHHYPRIRPPEFMEGTLRKFNTMMDEHGGRKPIWLTEYGYYADDDPSTVPMPNSGFNIPLESEKLQAAYVVRWNVIMMGGGVDKIFYHAGTCDGVNRDSLQGIFFEYAGQPHKVYTAQAVMARLFPVTCRFVDRLELGEGVRAYRFREGERTVLAAWAPEGIRAMPVTIAGDRIRILDLMGRPTGKTEFVPGPTPVYVVAERLSDEDFLRAVSLGRST